MSTQHTPGPWQFIPEDETAASLVESDGTSIMVMYALENSTGAFHFAANTQLICAAPDLLEALQNLLTFPLGTFQVEAARAAIDKATGAI